MRVCIVLALAATALGLPAAKDIHPRPTFADAYSATGYVLLPYANIVEPFTANFDTKLKKSRIDYYTDAMRTFQISVQYKNTPAQGAAFKVVWSPNAETHVPELVCYQANATQAAPVKIQTVFPDLTGFKYVTSEDCSTGSDHPEYVLKGKCDKWQLVVKKLERESTYSFWVQKQKDTDVPARYEMMGYDSLFSSHYDKYEMIYTSYKAGAQNDDVFDVVTITGECVPYPAGSGLASDHLFNPMQEFVRHNEDHLHEQFDEFKNRHGKSYESDDEETHRKDIFRQNLRYINSMNRKNDAFKMAVNHLADMSKDEFRVLRGRKNVPGYNGGRPAPVERMPRDLPTSVDWRTKGAVSVVKDQAICGSCWAFGTTGHIESMYFLKTGKMVKFSEQQLVDCSWNYGNGGCDGGQDYQAYRYIMDYGLASDDQYKPYMGVDGKCHDTTIDNKPLSGLPGYFNVTGVENLKKAVAFIGPISVGIDAAHESLAFYSHGVYKEPDCGNKPENLDHAVLAVGYGVSAGGDEYWIIKNSWSTYWGDQGYVLMSTKDNMCGVATAATYVQLPDELPNHHHE